jgi:Flp pilus assembly protein TadG
MKHQHSPDSPRERSPRFEAGQAAVEFALIAGLMLVLVCMVIDLCRAIHDEQLMSSLSREGSSLASRGTTLSDSAAAVIGGSPSLDLGDSGEVIITSVTNINHVYTITDQFSAGTISQSSKVGTGVGTAANMPASAASALQLGQTLYITEIFYSYQPITPIQNLLKILLPSTLYQAAYF